MVPPCDFALAAAHGETIIPYPRRESLGLLPGVSMLRSSAKDADLNCCLT